jgi:hypothetical protein
LAQRPPPRPESLAYRNRIGERLRHETRSYSCALKSNLMAEEIQLVTRRYSAQCTVRGCRVRATMIATYTDGQSRPLKQRELCDRHADWLKANRPEDVRERRSKLNRLSTGGDGHLLPGETAHGKGVIPSGFDSPPTGYAQPCSQRSRSRVAGYRRERS